MYSVKSMKFTQTVKNLACSFFLLYKIETTVGFHGAQVTQFIVGHHERKTARILMDLTSSKQANLSKHISYLGNIGYHQHGLT